MDTKTTEAPAEVPADPQSVLSSIFQLGNFLGFCLLLYVPFIGALSVSIADTRFTTVYLFFGTILAVTANALCWVSAPKKTLMDYIGVLGAILAIIFTTLFIMGFIHFPYLPSGVCK